MKTGGNNEAYQVPITGGTTLNFTNIYSAQEDIQM